MSLLIANKWVRIMSDFCAEGVWAKDGGACSIEDLPVSDGLKRGIIQWQHMYDELDYEDNDKLFKFSRAGFILAKKVKLELPDWTVMYFDEYKANVLWDKSRREEFEYEVTGE